MRELEDIQCQQTRIELVGDGLGQRQQAYPCSKNTTGPENMVFPTQKSRH